MGDSAALQATVATLSRCFLWSPLNRLLSRPPSLQLHQLEWRPPTHIYIVLISQISAICAEERNFVIGFGPSSRKIESTISNKSSILPEKISGPRIDFPTQAHVIDHLDAMELEKAPPLKITKQYSCLGYDLFDSSEMGSSSSPVFQFLQLTTTLNHHSSTPQLTAYDRQHRFKFNESRLVSSSDANKPSILRIRKTPSDAKTCRVVGATVSDVSSAISSDPAMAADVSWQIVVGAIAGVTPFVVAGIEFGKRIVAQRNCKTCKGSGLVLRDNKYYFRCPACGGFLPWQSWTRFFTG
ncbi:uncharacterized protein LOC127247329 [Andrographis paniculata]|uniref:uncharacterized protein LOC127247329 n=1 Tax=Andrographis paniculata TaxID=175694 RepID=UPI0021E720F5|nr:uncharacterized protein LOC127247329 [Andrographis paniculata]